MNEFILKTEDDRRRLLDFLSKLDISRPLKFTWKLYRQKRSLDANALLHVWLGEMLKHPMLAQNNELKKVSKKKLIEDLKIQMKERFLGNETVTYVNRKDGTNVTIERLRRTRDLDSGEFCFFMECVQSWAMVHLGIALTCNKNDQFAKWQEEQEG